MLSDSNVKTDPLNMDFQSVRQPLHFMKDQSAAPAWLLEANEEIKSADGFVVVLSEYNCGIPPALSTMMDAFPPGSYRHRPCSIVTYSMGKELLEILNTGHQIDFKPFTGDFGGVRAATLVQPFLSELGMIALPSRVALPTVHTKFDGAGEPNNDRFQTSVEKMTKELKWYVEALKNAKDSAGLP